MLPLCPVMAIAFTRLLALSKLLPRMHGDPVVAELEPGDCEGEGADIESPFHISDISSSSLRLKRSSWLLRTDIRGVQLPQAYRVDELVAIGPEVSRCRFSMKRIR